MSDDVVFGRLRALLGSSGVERDPSGVPRATPESSEALSLVCRLAHEEGWKIRVEGHASWLPPDAPADLALLRGPVGETLDPDQMRFEGVWIEGRPVPRR